MTRRQWLRRNQERISEILADFGHELGHTPTIAEYRAERSTVGGGGHRSWPSVSWIIGRFGSWSAACREAGMDPHPQGFPDDVVHGARRSPGRNHLKGNPERAAELGRRSAARHRELGSAWAARPWGPERPAA